MATRWCPICGQVKLIRREVRTCGSAYCLEQWRSYTSEQKARAIEKAGEMAEIPQEYLEVDKKSGNIVRRPIPVIPSEKDEEFLKTVFKDPPKKEEDK